jgi:predicted enzyme related to lactoylglutathione lyase
MKVEWVFFGVGVENFDRAIVWYGALFGRDADLVVTDDEMMWQLSDSTCLYVTRDDERHGRALLTIAVPDVDAIVDAIRDRGIEPGPVQQVGGAGRKVVVTDPEGNTFNFVELVAPGH